MTKDRNIYTYKGPVFIFENIVNNDWQAETFATSRKKALSNLSYRFKKEYGYSKNSSIKLIDSYLSEGGN